MELFSHLYKFDNTTKNTVRCLANVALVHCIVFAGDGYYYQTQKKTSDHL